MPNLNYGYEIKIVQNAVFDPNNGHANQWQRQVPGNTHWEDIAGGTGETYTVVVADRSCLIRLKQSSEGAAGYSNELQVTTEELTNINDEGWDNVEVVWAFKTNGTYTRQQDGLNSVIDSRGRHLTFGKNAMFAIRGQRSLSTFAGAPGGVWDSQGYPLVNGSGQFGTKMQGTVLVRNRSASEGERAYGIPEYCTGTSSKPCAIPVLYPNENAPGNGYRGDGLIERISSGNDSSLLPSHAFANKMSQYGGVYVPHLNQIVCPPGSARNIGSGDGKNFVSTVDFLTFNVENHGSISFNSIDNVRGDGFNTKLWGKANVLADNGKIYCMPLGHDSVLVLDTNNSLRASMIKLPWIYYRYNASGSPEPNSNNDDRKYTSVVYDPSSQCLYAFPYKGSAYPGFKLDTRTHQLTEIKIPKALADQSGPCSEGCGWGPDGKVYFQAGIGSTVNGVYGQKMFRYNVDTDFWEFGPTIFADPNVGVKYINSGSSLTNIRASNHPRCAHKPIPIVNDNPYLLLGQKSASWENLLFKFRGGVTSSRYDPYAVNNSWA